LEKDLQIVNRFLVLNFSFLQACLGESAAAWHWRLLVARIFSQMSSNFGIRSLDSSASDRSQILVKQVEIWQVLEFGTGLQKSGDVWHRRRIPATKFHLNWLEFGTNCDSLLFTKNISENF
jgi:hypothetical protein